MHLAALLAFEDAAHALQPGQHVPHTRPVGRVGDVDVGQLVVADGEGPAVERLQRLAERAVAHRQQPGLRAAPD